MAWRDGVRARLRANLHGRAADAELDEEFRFHVEMETERLERTGVAPGEARRRALVAFGGVAQHKETMRGARWVGWLEAVVRDARVAVRGLRRSPALVVGAVVSLGLAIGVNTAMFSFVNAILYKPLPVPAAARLVGLYVEQDGWRFAHVSRRDYLEYRGRLTSLAGLATRAFRPAIARVGDAPPRQWYVGLVSGNYFQVLGLHAANGRFFLPEEDRAVGAAAVVVVSDYFWREEMGGDPGVLGRTLQLNRHPFTIVGVAPPRFAGTTPPAALDIFVPATMAGVLSGRDAGAPAGGELIGALHPGVSLAQVRAEFTRASAELARDDPKAGRAPPRVTVVAMRGAMSDMRENIGHVLFILMATVATTLLVATANVAGLLLARAEARGRELAIQSSLGARPSALVRGFMVESLLLALPGAVLGFALALLGRDAMMAFFAVPLTTRTAIDLSPDLRVVFFTVAVTLVCALLLGGVSALRAGRRRDLLPALKGEGRAGRGRGRLAGAVVVAQVAIAVPLLFLATGMMHDVKRSLHADPGFRVSDVVHAEVQLDGTTYRGAQAAAAFYARLQRHLLASPDVASAGLMTSRLFYAIGPLPVALPGDAPPRPGFERKVPANAVTPEVLQILGVRTLRGRALDGRDRAGALPVAMVTTTLAGQLWPGRDAVGRQLLLGGKPYHVVGVVADAGFAGEEPPSPYVFLSYAQNPEMARTTTVLALSRTGSTRALQPLIRRAVAAIDPEVPLARVETLLEGRERGVQPLRALGVLIAICAGLTLVLAAVGTYALLAFRVARRSRELGVRMALGAGSRKLQVLVVRQGILLVGLGVILGLPLGPVGMRIFAYQHLAPNDRLLYALAAAGAVLAAAALASWLPARRATRVDPAAVLRLE